MKKIAKAFVSITCLVLLTVFTTGCTDKIDKKTLRQEQERMVEYTIQNYEDIKRIEFKNFEQNTSTRSWSSGAVINNEIYITYNLNDLSENGEISIVFHISASNGKKLKKKNNIENNTDIDAVEVHYWEG
ncbi:hypothetical protein [Gemella sanguinis]|jgi:hypothetical protein|uniref:hypothetical protein n=1 Tax=Gemella sanguinis TaxID=84135 RepID=UPI0028E9724A|nr:hypothetical protein [Gemella sanguinis]